MLCAPPEEGKWQRPVYDRLGVATVLNLSTKIRRMVGAKRPPDERRLMGWCEDALDLENACRYWGKAVKLLRSKVKTVRRYRLIPAA